MCRGMVLGDAEMCWSRILNHIPAHTISFGYASEAVLFSVHRPDTQRLEYMIEKCEIKDNVYYST